jgi:uncharacterized membrane protein (UPF0127 family)
MNFSFDAVFINRDLKNMKVVHIIETMCPFRISPIVNNAQMVLELPTGTIHKTGTKIGDQIVFCRKYELQGDDVN